MSQDYKNSVQSFKTIVTELENEVKNCEVCKEHKNDYYPRHFASANCQSGKQPHCTCDTCF